MIVTEAEERRVCPLEFQQRIDEIAGINRFGGSNFRVVWGQTRTELIGGMWNNSVGTKYVNGKEMPNITRVAAMEEVLSYGIPCWVLERWFGPENYGTQERWYAENTEIESGLPLLGPYPDEGYYETCYKLTVDKNPVELSDEVIDCLIPLILRAQDHTWWEKHHARIAQQEKIKKAAHDYRVDAYVEKAPFGGIWSYAGQTNKTARMDRDRNQSKISNKTLEQLLGRKLNNGQN